MSGHIIEVTRMSDHITIRSIPSHTADVLRYGPEVQGEVVTTVRWVIETADAPSVDAIVDLVADRWGEALRDELRRGHVLKAGDRPAGETDALHDLYEAVTAGIASALIPVAAGRAA